MGLSQPTVQRQTGRRRDLRSRFNFSFLHQSLSWLVLFFTVEVNYIIHYIMLYTLHFLSKSCLNHCALAYSLLFWVVIQLFLQADLSFLLLFRNNKNFISCGYFSPQFVQILQFLARWLLTWDVTEINSEFLSSADLHVTEGFLVIQVLRLSFSATLHWMILSALLSTYSYLIIMVSLSIEP